MSRERVDASIGSYPFEEARGCPVRVIAAYGCTPVFTVHVNADKGLHGPRVSLAFSWDEGAVPKEARVHADRR